MRLSKPLVGTSVRRAPILALLLATAGVPTGCSNADQAGSLTNGAPGAGGNGGSAGFANVPGGRGGAGGNGYGGGLSAAGATAGGLGGGSANAGGVGASGGGAGATGTGSGGSVPGEIRDAAAHAGNGPTFPDAGGRMIAGVNVHDYPKPTAYGYLAADGKDRMGDALVQAGVTRVRGPIIGDVTFFARLAAFGVKETTLGLSASAHGKPFDPATVQPLLKKSLAAATAARITLQVEGLNEWDLFNTRSYNAGVLPPGMSASEFVLFTQKALYEAAHPLGLVVLGPSVGHPGDAASLAFFPNVSAYVDIVNMHSYFTSNPESVPLAARVRDHQAFQGLGKPLWVTETGISSYGSVTDANQADVIRRGLAGFAASGLVDRAFLYELLDDQKPGLNGTTYTPDDAEYHFGMFTFEGAPKPAETPLHDFIVAP